MACTIASFRPIDKEIPVPLYYQLKSQIMDMIKQGMLVEGDPIPPENDLTGTLGISRPTVRQALSELVMEGYLERRKGKGTFVSSPKIDVEFLMRLKTFNEEMEEKGLVPSTKLLSLTRIPAIEKINEKLGLDEEADLIELRRVRCANDEPILYQETYLPYDRFPKLMEEDFAKTTLYRAMEDQYDVHVTRVHRDISSMLASEEVAQMLSLEPKGPVTLVRTVAYTAVDLPVEYSISHYCGNKMSFSVELYR